MNRKSIASRKTLIFIKKILRIRNFKTIIGVWETK